MKRTKREKGEWNDRMTVNWLLLGHFNLGFLFSKKIDYFLSPSVPKSFVVLFKLRTNFQSVVSHDWLLQ